MSIGVPADEPAGDMADQATRLQMAQEQEAIAAALSGHVHGSDALEDRDAGIEPLEGRDPLDDGDDSSDDPVHGGGQELVGLAELDRATDIDDLATDDALLMLDEGASADDPVPLPLEQDGDPDVLDDAVIAVDGEPADLDALADIAATTHDPDDPDDPDGYGVPPAAD